MKKFVCILLVALTAVFAFCSCGLGHKTYNSENVAKMADSDGYIYGFYSDEGELDTMVFQIDEEAQTFRQARFNDGQIYYDDFEEEWSMTIVDDNHIMVRGWLEEMTLELIYTNTEEGYIVWSDPTGLDYIMFDSKDTWQKAADSWVAIENGELEFPYSLLENEDTDNISASYYENIVTYLLGN